MATFRASNTLSAATRTNSTLTKPTGTASGDLLVMFFNIESDVLPQPPSGWRFGYNIDHSGAAVDQWIFWKRAGASEPASYTITHSSTWTNGYIVAVQNVSQTVNPSFSAPAQGTGTTATANSVTSVGADAWIGFFVNTFGDQGAATPPSGSTPTFTERYESTNNIYAADGTLASAGSTGTKSITFAGSQQWMATLMVVEDVATTATAPFVVQPAYAALASANPSLTFDVPVAENDVVVMWATSTTVGTLNTAPAGWVNVLGGTTLVASDSHSAACVYHKVTAAEALAQTLTYTCTGLFTASQTGTVLGALVRNVDPTTPLDSAASTFSSANTATPHVLAGLTGANVGDGSIVLSAVAKDTTGAYSTLPSGWEFLVSYNTNQGSALFRREDNTTAGVAVAATNVTPSAGDEYVSITVALTPASSSGPQTVNADPGTLTFTGVQSTLTGSSPVTVTADVAALTFTGVQPTLAGAGTITVTADTATVTLAGVDPTLTATGAATVTADTATLTFAGVDAALTPTGAVTVTADTAVLVWEGVQPDLATAGGPQTVTAESGALTWTGVQPTLTGSGAVTVTADTAAVTWAGVDASLAPTGAATVTAESGAVTWAGVQPSLTGAGTITVTADTGALSWTGVQATLGTGATPQTIDADPGALTWTGVQATLTPTGAATITVDTGTVTYTGTQPTLAGVGTATVTADTGTVSWTGTAITLDAVGTVTVTVDSGQLTWTPVAVTAAMVAPDQPGRVTSVVAAPGATSTVTAAAASSTVTLSADARSLVEA